MSPPERHSIELHHGRLCIPHTVHQALFAQCVAAALLADEGGWWLFPLLGGGGGLQFKVRNRQGDRVIEAQEFFRQQGLEDSPEPQPLALVFHETRGAFAMVPTTAGTA